MTTPHRVNPPRIVVPRTSWTARRAHSIRRRRRRHLAGTVRELRRDLAVVGALVVVGSVAAVAVPRASALSGFVDGMVLGVVVALLAVALLVRDGSLLAWIGLSVERSIARELRRARGAYGVVTDVWFERCDVDAVVLTPSGVLVVEVKWSMHHRWRGSGTHAATGQVRDAARKVRGLLRSAGLDVPVVPVLALYGPGAPDLVAREREGDVLVTAGLDRRGWSRLIADLTADGTVLAPQRAQAVAHALVSFRDQRHEHERSRRQVGAEGARIAR